MPDVIDCDLYVTGMPWRDSEWYNQVGGSAACFHPTPPFVGGKQPTMNVNGVAWRKFVAGHSYEGSKLLCSDLHLAGPAISMYRKSRAACVCGGGGYVTVQ